MGNYKSSWEWQVVNGTIWERCTKINRYNSEVNLAPNEEDAEWNVAPSEVEQAYLDYINRLILK